MTQVRPDVDLGRLTRERAAVRRPRRLAKFLVPLAILMTFGGVLATSLRDVFGTVVDVTTIRPRPSTGSASGAAPGAVALQAAGWVEPEPYPVRVTALASGVVKELLVLESDVVKRGDPVARLVDDEARLGADKADAALEEARAELARAKVEDQIARESFEAALSVTENAAAMRARAAGKAAESRHRAAAVAGGESDLVVVQEELAIQKELAKKGAEGPRAVELAEAKVRSARAALEVMKADAALASNEAAEADVRAIRAARDLELRLDDRLRRDLARAGVGLAEARVKSAEATAAEAKLRLERMTIRAPSDGVVMERVAVVGTTLHSEDPDHSTVCLLFDPAHVRVRVDVSQSDVAKAFPGQKAEIQSQSRPQKPYHGSVIRIVQRADIQKVTLQVHVRVEDGDALLRPEMLCQVRLLAPAAGPDSAPVAGGAAPAGVMVPSRVLVDDRFVWTVDPEAPRARKRPVDAGERSGEWVVIRSGLNVTDKVIDVGREHLEEGVKIRARGGE
jgi:RND family efflux transporter MFP subunit